MTREMLRHADALVCYRTYPHIDMAETGQRAAAARDPAARRAARLAPCASCRI